MFAARCAADGVEPRALVPAQRGRYNAEIKAWRAARVTADQFEAAVADWKTTWKGRQPGATPSRADLDAAIARVRSRGATSPETPLQEQQRLQQVFLGAAAAQPSAAAAEGDMPF